MTGGQVTMTDLRLRAGTQLASTCCAGLALLALPTLVDAGPGSPATKVLVAVCATKAPVPKDLVLATRQARSGDREALYGLLHHHMSLKDREAAFGWVSFAVSQKEWSLAVPYWKRMRLMGGQGFCRRADGVAAIMLESMAKDDRQRDRRLAEFYRGNLKGWLAASPNCDAAQLDDQPVSLTEEHFAGFDPRMDHPGPSQLQPSTAGSTPWGSSPASLA
jgi:hypothetical protein